MIVHVKEKGGYYVVYQDAATLKPAVINNYEDEPLGAVGLVPVDKATLDAQFPGAEFVVHSLGLEQNVNKPGKLQLSDAQMAKLTPEQITQLEKEMLRKNVAAKAKVRAFAAKQGLEYKAEKVSSTTAPSLPQGETAKGFDVGTIATLMEAFAPNKEDLPKALGVEKGKALEFLKRIEYAIEYASDENKYALEIQVSIIKKLLKEVFGTKPDSGAGRG